MAIRVVPLASGSSGNCTLVEVAGKRLLIDVGCSVVDTEAMLEQVGVAPKSVDGVLITHRHRDHVRGATEFCSKHRARVYAVRRTSRSLGTEVRKRLTVLHPMRWCELSGGGGASPEDSIRVLPILVEHDAPDTVAFLLEAGDGERYGHATDLGCADGPIGELLTHCRTLYLEFNHDLGLLASYPDYSAGLKERIAGPRGHLNNQDAQVLLARLVQPELQKVWVAHVSSRTNTPERALQAARDVLPESVDAELAPTLEERLGSGGSS